MCHINGVVAHLFRSVLVVMFCFLTILAQDEQKSLQQSSAPEEPGNNIRDVFLSSEAGRAATNRTVGRLGILLKTKDGAERVRPDYPFHTGDKFRLEVTANRNGWLYVLHAAPGGKLKQLWPRSQDDNTIKAGQTYEIPPSPGVFVFDENVGQEYFYVAIRQKRVAPNLEVQVPAGRSMNQTKRTQTSHEKEGNADITNFVIRDPFGETGRGVVFDPGAVDSDPYLYFSAVAKDQLNSAMIEFQLKHVE